VAKLDAEGVQHQSPQAGIFGQHPVVMPVTMLVVADNRVENMFHVPPDLAVSSGMRCHQQQRIA